MNRFKKGIFFGLSLMMFNLNVYACSLGGEMVADAFRIKAILDFVTSKPTDRDRYISSIKKNSSELYIIETKVNNRNCRAMGFTAAIQPSCAVEVERVHKKFSCG